MDKPTQTPFQALPPSAEAVEGVWVGYWAPKLSTGGIAALKGELYDAYHLVNEARKVYRHVTGGLTDDLCASGEGIIALADSRVGDLTEALTQRIAELERIVELLQGEGDEAGVEEEWQKEDPNDPGGFTVRTVKG